MTKLRMPTTLPSIVDRKDLRFIALDRAGNEWHWDDQELIWVVAQEPDDDEDEFGGRKVVH